ncbi:MULTISPECIES: helix-turn-helix domain-containing protein [Actinomadura]|uniref:DUF6597 domain-containing transcriptional factor n=1 Tax=Actinomadura yumaensis TaxID=111807 RepID=A0ABW2CUF5_9ACTN|nr:AraC family transcriptional regulator [Actinomadura sp. J1-007]MWK33273.1 helix-turn-helix domain-containing protein [Actinomadura sp. J1-007]
MDARPPRGVLYPDEHAPRVETSGRAPDPPSPFVELYWHVRWRVGAPYDSKVLSYPNVHLVFEEPAPLVYGPVRGLFVRRLEGEGQVLGVKFRPGAFRSFTTGPVAELADRRVPAETFLGPGVAEAGRAVLAAASLQEMIAAAERFLLPLLPAAPDPAAVEAAGMVDRLMADPGLLRVDQAAREFGVSVRTLQRLFADHVGTSPKWVLRRARLHEAASRADSGAPVDWARLATDLGYADQSHLTRDFTATVGVPPAAYSRS